MFQQRIYIYVESSMFHNSRKIFIYLGSRFGSKHFSFNVNQLTTNTQYSNKWCSRLQCKRRTSQTLQGQKIYSLWDFLQLIKKIIILFCLALRIKKPDGHETDMTVYYQELLWLFASARSPESSNIGESVIVMEVGNLDGWIEQMKSTENEWLITRHGILLTILIYPVRRCYAVSLWLPFEHSDHTFTRFFIIIVNLWIKR